MLEVTHLGAQGDGIAQGPGGPVFLPFMAPGDRVDLAGQVPRLVTTGPHRVAPLCRHFGRCGGCATQHVDAAYQAAWKRELVAQALGHRGLDGGVVAPTISIPPGRRRRATFAILRLREKIVLGFNERASASLVDLEECPVLRPELAALLAPLRTLLARVLPPGGRKALAAQAHVLASDSGIDLWLEVAAELDLKRSEALSDFAAAHDLARLSWGRPAMTVAERRRPVVQAGQARIAPAPGAFLQASAEGEAVLAQHVGTAVGDANPVADLFSGCGTFALRLAEGRSVQAFDAEGEAIAACRTAAQGRALAARSRDLFRAPLLAAELNAFAAVVLDPPRAGARAQVEQLAASTVPVVAMASCNPGTFARDARILVDGGYQLEWVVPVDQFPMTPHVELVARFARNG
ncbi:class I SAM-dependent RNA methyltransferase [Zavarzinia sp. CC-PAN008]|uniref:class I SAM-dependent RNA methyltransferase n=1 Tax=Zavarzinia sp. CC-PAN008 TaxID=3243332 RepID=UPI003F744B7E